MEGIKVTIGEREIPLKFGMDQFADMEEEIGYLGEINELLLKGRKRIRNTVTAIRIMGNAALKKAGEKPDLTNEWLMENMEPAQLSIYQLAVLDCMRKAEKSEAKQEKEENEERDLVLEEIEAKKDPVNSHTGG